MIAGRLYICQRSSPALLWTQNLTAVPVLGKEVEEDVLARMRQGSVFVQRNAEVGTLWQGEVAIDDFGIAGGDRLDPLVGEVVEVLLNLEIGGGGGEVEHGGSGDGTTDVVRSHQ